MKTLQKYQSYSDYTKLCYNTFVYKRKFWNQFQSMQATVNKFRKSFNFSEV